MTQNDIRALFEEIGVVRRGHFLRSSGRHADLYVQCARLFEDTEKAREMCAILADSARGTGPDLVMSAAIGGLLAGNEVARALQKRHIYCERRDGAMTLRRGFSFSPGARVLLVEDEVTTGSSVREMCEIVRALGGTVAGIACVVDKSGGRLAFDAPFFALCTVTVNSYRENACPLCAEHLPMDRV